MLNKRNLSIILLIAVFGACDVLNIDPEQSVPTDLVFADEQGARTAVVGMYAGLREGNAWGGFPLMAADFRADNSQHVGSFTTWEQVRRYDVSPENGTVQGVWADNYVSISRANEILANVSDVPDLDEELMNQWRGEALFVRALSHFQVVKWFAQPYGFTEDNSHPGIPVITSPTDQDDPEADFIPRSTVAEVYEQIISDLLEAEQLVAEETSTVGLRGGATTGSVHALLSRVYLYQSDWENAAEYAGQVIDNPNYSLQGDYGFFDSPNTAEDVFAIQMTVEDNPGVNAAMAALHMPTPIGRGDINPTQSLLDAYEEGDQRREQLLFEQDGRIWSAKYTSEQNDDNVHIIRIAEVILTRAEALAELQGVNDESITLVNQVRGRAGLDDISPGSPDELIDAILQERRIELAFEGHRKFDLLRRGENITNIPSADVDTIEYGDPRMIFPIPQRELDVNPELEPNP